MKYLHLCVGMCELSVPGNFSSWFALVTSSVAVVKFTTTGTGIRDCSFWLTVQGTAAYGGEGHGHGGLVHSTNQEVDITCLCPFSIVLCLDLAHGMVPHTSGSASSPQSVFSDPGRTGSPRWLPEWLTMKVNCHSAIKLWRLMVNKGCTSNSNHFY